MSHLGCDRDSEKAEITELARQLVQRAEDLCVSMTDVRKILINVCGPIGKFHSPHILDFWMNPFPLHIS